MSAVEGVVACDDYIFDAAWLGDGEASLVGNGGVEPERGSNACECNEKDCRMHVEMHDEVG